MLAEMIYSYDNIAYETLVIITLEIVKGKFQLQAKSALLLA